MIDLILQTFIGKNLEQEKKTFESVSVTLKLNILKILALLQLQ